MNHDISELLQAARDEAAAEAPPMRRSVEEVVASGRRRDRRRRVVLATGGSAALVAAVLAATGLPGASGTGAVPAASVAASVAVSAPAVPMVYPAGLFDLGFRGYTAGPFEVSAPILVTPGYQEAYVRKNNEMLDLYGDGGAVVASSPGYSAMLTVYRPGVFKPTRFAGGTPVTVHGRPGLYGADITYQQDGNPHPRPALAWQYADDAWAVVSNLTPTVYSKADLIKVAEGLGGSPATPVTVAFKTSWTPPGYVLTSAGATDDYPNGAPYMVSSIRLVKQRPAYRDLVQPVDAAQTGTPTVRVALYPVEFTDTTHRRPGASAYCNPGNADLCYRMTADARYLAEVYSNGGLSQDDLKRILDGLEFAQVPDRTTWFPITAA